ncbi:MAG: sialate O-acetylesterase [Verrucomicrobia subdivision 3 bacterium]|nr:sialate O-acetylesterase [Limisphaerales bacterium]
MRRWILGLLATSACALQAADANFHLYLLIGQSNMAGRGKIALEDKVAVPRVLMLNKANEWVSAVDPISFDKTIAGVSLGRTFGITMAKANPNLKIGLIPCAVGGTPIRRWQRNGDLYKAALKRAAVAQKKGVIKGILWHQGENDSGKEATAKIYEQQLHAMISAWRKDLGDKNIPIVVGEMGHFFKAAKFKPTVDAALKALPGKVNHAAWVSAEGLGHKGDVVHFNAAGYREFGKRYAVAMKKLLGFSK